MSVSTVALKPLFPRMELVMSFPDDASWIGYPTAGCLLWNREPYTFPDVIHGRGGQQKAGLI